MNETVKRILKEGLPLLGLLIGVLLIKWLLITPIRVNGTSMYPTLKDGDIMILNKISYKIHGIKRFDIVVIDKGDELLIKRVIGLPNETVKIEDDKLYINGEFVEQPFLKETNTTGDFEAVIENDYYFVMGDNRGVSLDSRELGAFHIDKIKGTTSLVIFPFSRIGKKN